MKFLSLTVILTHLLALCNSDILNCPNNVPSKFQTATDSNPPLTDVENPDSGFLNNRIRRAHILLTTSQLLGVDLQTGSCAANPFFDALLLADSICIPQYPTSTCSLSANGKYRPVDGKLKQRCKNTGKSFEPFVGMERVHYEDCLWDMAKAK